MTGQCCVPIISRTSYGPTFSVFNPDDVGVVNPIPSKMLAGYPAEHTNLGPWDAASTYYGGTDQLGSVAFPAGTRSILLTGRHGDNFCYGPGTANLALVGTIDLAVSAYPYCYDPLDSLQGNHGPPYRPTMWAYDANDLIAVKQGTKKPWDVQPYAKWTLPGMSIDVANYLRAGTYDPVTQRYYVGSTDSRDIYVFQINIGTPGDVTPPTVSMTAPSGGATVSGPIAVSATASDNTGVGGVQFKLDGANLGGEDTTSSYSVTWDTTTATNGSHTLTATARDAAGNTTTSSSVMVTVSNTVTTHTKDRANSYDDAWQTGASGWVENAKSILAGGNQVPGLVLWIGDSLTRGPGLAAWAQGGSGKTSEDISILNWMNAGLSTQSINSIDGFALATPYICSNRSFTVGDGLAAWEFLGGSGMPHDTNPTTAKQKLLDCTTYPRALTLDTMLAAIPKAQFAIVAVNMQATPSDITTMTQMFDMLIANKIVPIIITYTYRASATFNLDVDTYNNALVAYAQSKKLPLIDLNKEMLLRLPYSSWPGRFLEIGDDPHYTNGSTQYPATSDPYAAGGNPSTHSTGLALTYNGYGLKAWLGIQKMKEIKQLVIDTMTGDTTAPTVSITAPTNGATVSGSSVTVSANASDTVGVVGVQFKIDGVNLGSEDTTSSYSTILNTTTVSNGTHTLTAVARDAAGNTTTSSGVSVTVNNVSGNTIIVNPAITLQTMRGWEVVAQADQYGPYFNNYQNAVLDKVVEAGINRVRFEVRSGSENTTDSFLNWKNAGYPSSGTAYTTWRAKRYETINDNSSPTSMDLSKFYWTEIDSVVDTIINPLKAKLAIKGESLYVNFNYVAFYGAVTSGQPNVHQDPAEYAEFMLAAFQHLQSKYGWVPNAIEVVLEPDNTTNWGGVLLGQIIAATGARLSANGFNPDFIAPATTNMTTASTWFDQMWTVTAARPYIDELSYHRYSGVSTASLQAIAGQAQTAGISTAMLEWWDTGNTFNLLHEDLKVGRNSAWEQSVMVDTANPGGLAIAYVNPSNPTVATLTNPTKFYQQYYKFVRMGATRVDATSNNSSFDPFVFRNTDGKYTVVVKANSSGTFSISGLPAGTYGIYYTVSSTGSPANPDQYAISQFDQTISSGQTLTTSIPGYGVATIYGKTGGGGGDTTAPTVSITAPTNGATVSGSSVTVSANASDTVGVVGVQFKIDGVNLGSEDTTSSYSTILNTTTVSNGTHTLTAVARDAAGNTTTSSGVSVTVSNPNTFQRTIQIDPEGRISKILSGTLNVLNPSKVSIKTYPFTTNSTGQSTITFDISPQVVYLKLNPSPFLARLISLDLNTNSIYVFPKLLNGDIVQDNIINSVDYSALNTKWFTSDATSDLNKDGLVNSIDFSLMNQHWLTNGEV